MNLAPARHFGPVFDQLWVALLSRFEVSGIGLMIRFVAGFNADFTSSFLWLNRTLGNVTSTGNILCAGF